MKKLAVFDLDGTIIDSVTDIMASMNYVLDRHQLETFEREDYITFIGSGSRVLTERALAKNQITDEKMIDLIHHEYLEYYKNHCLILTKEYEDVTTTLQSLKAMGVKLAILSNKPHRDCQTIANQLFPGLFDEVLGVSADFPPKPNFMSLKYLLNSFKCSKKEAIYVGDSIVDLTLAADNQIDLVYCMYGYSSDASVNQKILDSHKSKVHLLYRFSELQKIVLEDVPFKTQFISKKLSLEQISEIYSELSAQYQYDGFEYFYFENDPDYVTKVENLMHKFKPNYLVMHVPFERDRLNLSSVDENRRVTSVNLVKQAIDFGIAHNTNRFVFHTGFKDNPALDDLVYYFTITKSIQELLEYTKEKRVLLMMENLVGREEITDQADVLKMFLDLIKNYRLRLTFDVGHANVAKINYTQFLKKFRNSIQHLHLNNNFKDQDSHSKLTEGNIPYPKIIKLLKKLRYQGSISIETGFELSVILENNHYLKKLGYYQ